MSADLHLGVGPLTGRVYVGRLLKDGMTWAAGKQDVTTAFLACVVEKFGPNAGETKSVHGITDRNGKEMFEITVRRIEG